jgi:hypothetical protein
MLLYHVHLLFCIDSGNKIATLRHTLDRAVAILNQ